MKYTPTITRNEIILELEKPIYGTVYGVWAKWLKKAKDYGLDIVIKTNQIEKRFTFEQFMSGAERIERKFKYNKPMIFYKRDILL